MNNYMNNLGTNPANPLNNVQNLLANSEQQIEQQKMLQQEQWINQQFLQTDEGRVANEHFINARDSWLRKRSGQIAPETVEQMQQQIQELTELVKSQSEMMQNSAKEKGGNNGKHNNR